MIRVSQIAHGSTLLATGALAIGYALSGLPAGAPLIAAWGVFWLIGRQRGWGWAVWPGLAGLVSAAAFGVWRGIPAAWMLFAAVAALVAWDLDALAQRARSVGQVAGEAGLIQAHLRRVLIVGGGGLALGEIAASAQVEFSFGWALLLGLLALAGLGLVVGFLRRESD